MKCLICLGEAVGEVCDKCIRLEKSIYQREWQYKQGMLSKAEDYRIAISNLRISGRVSICDNPRGTNARLDNMSHFLLNVKECSQVPYQGKKALMIVIENNTGQNMKYTRYCFLPGFEDMDGLTNEILEAKKKAASLVERMRPGGGAPGGAPPRPAAPSMGAAARPASAASAVAAARQGAAGGGDISEFETKIKKLKVLRDNGILSEEEYQEEKKKLVTMM